MVLENASDPAGSDSFYENAPASDDDPYSTSTPQAGSWNYKIDSSKLAQPIPIIGPLTGFTQDFFSKALNKTIQRHGEILKRPPTQEEVEAIAYHTAKQISIYSYAAPAGVLAGAWRANATQATFRFPFWQPNLEKFNPQVFPYERMALGRGNRAVLLWHATRYALYGYAGMFVSKLLFGSYSMSVAAVGEMTDPRLKAVQEATKQLASQRRGGLPGPKMSGTAGSPQGGGAGQRRAPPVDDASPTSGMFDDESNGFENDAYSANEGSQRQEKPQPIRLPQRPSTPPVPIQQTQSGTDPFYSFDNASATGGQDGSIDSSSPQPKRHSSAWDQIRQSTGRGAAGGQTDPGQAQEQPRGWAGVREQAQNTNSDFSFSKRDEERNLAKNEAQQDFDARVERERKGGDFSIGNGDQKRW
jgi:hypothetical protein